MNEIIAKRRSEMLKQRAMGHPLSEVVNQLHREYNVSKTWLYQEWRNRMKWIPLVLDVTDSMLTYWDLLTFHNELKDMTIRAYLKADNSNATIGALRLLRDINKDFMELIITRDVLERVDRLEAKR